MPKNAVSFFMALIPPTTTFQAKELAVRKGKPVIFDSQELKAVKQKLMAHLSKHIPSEPIVGALMLTVHWCYPVDEKHHGGMWKTSKPDTDNLEKSLKDCMQKLGFFKDDSQVCREIVLKYYNDVPGIYITLEQLEDMA